MQEQAMWERGIESLRDGEVETHDGRPVHFRSLLKRRWGWPKKSAYRAADFLLEEAESSGRVAELWVSKKKRDEQQRRLFAELPGLLEDLCHGLSRGVAQREAFDAGHEVDSILLTFDDPISDDGLSADVLQAVASRLGTNVDELRGAVRFDTATPELRFLVEATRFDP